MEDAVETAGSSQNGVGTQRNDSISRSRDPKRSVKRKLVVLHVVNNQNKPVPNGCCVLVPSLTILVFLTCTCTFRGACRYS